MKCKNCGHKISDFHNHYRHTTKITKVHYEHKVKCYCGCVRPEPLPEKED